MNFTSPFTARTYGATDNNANNLATTFGKSTATGTTSETYALGNTGAGGSKAAVGGSEKDFWTSTTSTGTNVALVYLPSGLSGRKQEALTSMHGLLETVGLSCTHEQYF
jgi:hypothetical protein